jgi:hypothetical protein
MTTKFTRLDFEISGGRAKLKDLSRVIAINEEGLREQGEDVVRVADKVRGRDREVYHINKTTLTINYEGDSIPVSIFGEGLTILLNKTVYEKLLGTKIIPAGEHNYNQGKK